MKVFISSDMEGTAGVVDWSQCMLGEPEYDYYRTLLQAEVNAAIEGARAAGANAFLVNDSHSKMQNLRPDTLAGHARYLSGSHKPMYMMEGLDASFDAIFFVSYHGSMSTSAPLSHTYNPRAIAEVSLKVLPMPPAEATLVFECHQADALRLLNGWGGQPLPLNASRWTHEQGRGRLWLRLRGATAAVAAACERLQNSLRDVAARMRSGYNVKQGEQLRARKARLEQQRRAGKCR